MAKYKEEEKTNRERLNFFFVDKNILFDFIFFLEPPHPSPCIDSLLVSASLIAVSEILFIEKKTISQKHNMLHLTFNHFIIIDAKVII